MDRERKIRWNALRRKVFPAIAAMLLILLLSGISTAIDPGTADGTLELAGSTYTLSHAYAHVHDNAERLLKTPRELRILLTDREAPQEILAGPSPVPALLSEARRSGLQGILILADPALPDDAAVLLISPRAGLSSSSMKPAGVKNLRQGNLRVSGEARGPVIGDSAQMAPPTTGYAVRFSAPLFHEPRVSASLSGKAAQHSPQARLLRKKARALSTGDIPEVRSVLSSRAVKEFDAALVREGDRAGAWMKKEAGRLERASRAVRRVVVRGESAVLVMDNRTWTGFVREGGEWKIDRESSVQEPSF